MKFRILFTGHHRGTTQPATATRQRLSRLSTGVILVSAAGLCWGLSGGIAAMLIAEGHAPLQVAFVRGATGFIFALAWLAWVPRRTGLRDRRLWLWSAVAGLGIAGNFGFYTLSIAEGNVAIAATLMYCAPIVVFLVSFALGFERATLAKWLAVLIVIGGIVLLTRVHQLEASAMTWPGVMFGLLAGLSYALFLFGFKYAAGYGSAPVVLSVAFLVLSLILAWPAGARTSVTAISLQDLPMFMLLGTLGAGVSFAFYVSGLRLTAPAVASVLATIEPVVASLFGVLVLDESLLFSQAVGLVLVLVAVAALGAVSTRPRSNLHSLRRQGTSE